MDAVYHLCEAGVAVGHAITAAYRVVDFRTGMCGVAWAIAVAFVDAGSVVNGGVRVVIDRHWIGAPINLFTTRWQIDAPSHVAAFQPIAGCAFLVEYKVDAEWTLGQCVGVQVYIQYSGGQRINGDGGDPLNNGAELPWVAHLELTEGVSRVVGDAKFKVVPIVIAVGIIEEGHRGTIRVTWGQFHAMLEITAGCIRVEGWIRFVC